jgi:phage repressor protein C with HTH and peptisase S24 domain
LALDAAAKQRLSEALKEMRGDRSQRAFAEVLGVGAAAVQQWERAKGGDPSYDSIQKIAKLRDEHPDEFIAYLLGREKQEAIPQPLTSNVVSYDSGDYVKIPIVAVVGAGGGANPYLEVTDRGINFPLELFKKLFTANPGYVDALEVMGDSMNPTLNPGDLVLIDTQSLDVSSGIYVFVYEGDILVKRLARIGRKISIISDNSVYPSQELSSADIDFKILGKVFYVCQKV